MNWQSIGDRYVDYLRDESRLSGHCDTIFFPENTQALQQALADCVRAGIPVTVQGGRTGIAAAGIPAGGRLICVGTTSVRTIETVADEDGIIHPGSGETSIFIKPGVRIKAVDALITNFHLPQSTLLMLVSTFMGREAALSAYELAVREQYRFFSFGDAMLILPTEPKDQKGNEDEYATAADV